MRVRSLLSGAVPAGGVRTSTTGFRFASACAALLGSLATGGCSGNGGSGPGEITGPASIRRNQIVFVSARAGALELFVTNDDGSGVRQLTRSSLEGRREPDVSPDGSKIAFAMWPAGVSCHPNYPTCGYEIHVANADGSGERRLTSNQENDGYPVWSPDGSKIAYSSAQSGTMNIHVMNVDGTGKRQVTTLAGWNYQPTWSPDGTRIAFVRSTDNVGVFVVSADGSGTLTRVSPGFGETPAWSPDGTRIAYANVQGLAVSNPDGTGLVQLTTHGFDWGPTWSPDGARLAFARGYDAVYVVNADGTGLVRLTDHPAQSYDPSWGRAP
jgi:TolB protein